MSLFRVPDLKVNKSLDTRALVVFFRLLRFYKTFNIVSALVSGLALATLTFPEFHPALSPEYRAAEGFLVSSASTSVISIMLGTMLLFWYEGYDSATRKDLALAWVPLVTLDWAIVAYVMGLLLWYGEKNGGWRTALVGGQTGGLLLFVVMVASWMWIAMSRKGGLGRMEHKFDDERRKVISRAETSFENHQPAF